MKHTRYIHAGILLLTVVLTVACNSYKKKARETPQTTEETASIAPSSRLLTDSLLPQSVNLDQDISRLSYEELRILRSYPYALHGYWFIEGDLNSFFRRKTDWYYDLCYKVLMDSYEQDLPYADTYSKVALTAEEKAFVEKIDHRMAQMARHRHITREGCELLNPFLCVNLFQMERTDKRFLALLDRCNFAIAPMGYEQLFHVYEANDYHEMPSFITTDVYLQAFHMYFSYALKSLERNHFTPALQELLQTLAAEEARTGLQGIIDAQEAQITASDATTQTVSQCSALLQASLPYFSKLDEAATYVNEAAYGEAERSALQATMDEQTGLLLGIDNTLAFTDLIRQLDDAILAVRLTQLPGDTSDYTFAIRSADMETFGANGDPLGWTLSLTNGDAKVKNGQHYSGNGGNHYCDSYNATPGTLFYTGNQTIEGLPNGTYTLRCVARSSGQGAFITARTATQDLKQEITKQGTEGNDGGPIWENAEEGSAEKAVNGGKGFGWQFIEITGLKVTDHTLEIGFTNDSYITGTEWTGTWFSVDDFRLFYLSDKTVGVESVRPADTGFRATGGKGCIHVVADAPYQVFHMSGMQINRTEGLAPGIYLVKCGQEVRKVQVQP